MVRHGVAVATLALAVTSQGPAFAQSSPERWSAAVFVRTPGGAPMPIRVADKRAEHTKNPSLSEIPPLPQRKTSAGIPAKLAEKPTPEPEVWQPQEIAAAKARCAKLLKGLQAVAVPQPPLRDGRCGTPAPIRLHSLGKVAFSPAPLLDCEMAASLSTWINKNVQPLAVKHLGARIAKIEVMSDYSCRNVAGTKRLSEHSYANALDIRGFVTEGGTTARVLKGWGKTKRDIAEEIEAAKTKPAVSALKDRTITAALSDPRNATTQDALQMAAKLNGPPPPERKIESASKKYASLGPQHSLTASPEPQAPPEAPKLNANAKFLRAAHAAACRIFGTTLGPEANKAHRNHFHVDMAERKWKKICD